MAVVIDPFDGAQKVINFFWIAIVITRKEHDAFLSVALVDLAKMLLQYRHFITWANQSEIANNGICRIERIEITSLTTEEKIFYIDIVLNRRIIDIPN